MQNSYKWRLKLEHELILYWINIHNPTIWTNRLIKYIITWDIWKHYVSIRIGQKDGLIYQVKSPIGAKRTFQIYGDPHELAKESEKDNKWWKKNSFILFFGEKEGGRCGQKTRQVPLD